MEKFISDVTVAVEKLKKSSESGLYAIMINP